MRTISKKDIEWKNTPMLIKFLNEQGKLFNRYQSRLPTSTHRKVAKIVKKMRHLGILPFAGLIQPTDKIPVGSYIQDIEELHKKTIDPVTGRIFMKHTIQDDLRDKRVREKAMVDRKSEKIASLAEEKAE
jgi:small subunit ribosomal protein S18